MHRHNNWTHQHPVTGWLLMSPPKTQQKASDQVLFLRLRKLKLLEKLSSYFTDARKLGSKEKTTGLFVATINSRYFSWLGVKQAPSVRVLGAYVMSDLSMQD